MAKKTEIMKLAEMQLIRDMAGLVIDLIKNPVVTMIGGVLLVNGIHKANPDLYSENVRLALQTAAIAYPAVAGFAGSSGTNSLAGAAPYVVGGAAGSLVKYAPAAIPAAGVAYATYEKLKGLPALIGK